ncbi:MAG: DUF4912 domain-containing protein [Methylococcaceae bacterium]
MSTNKYWQSINNSEIQLNAKELCDISHNISEHFAPDKDHPTLELVALPVDPHHLYVYWNLDETTIAAKKSNFEQETLILRVFWRPQEITSFEGNKLWFDVPIEQQQHHSLVRLPVDETAYSCSVGWRNDNARFTPVVYSNLIHVPRERMGSGPQSTKKTPSLQSAMDITNVYSARNDIAGEYQTYDKQGVEHKIRQVLIEKSQKETISSLGFARQNATDNRVHNSSYDEVLIDYQIKRTLNQKGINIIRLDQSVTTTKSAVSDSDSWLNNPSGQNSPC